MFIQVDEGLDVHIKTRLLVHMLDNPDAEYWVIKLWRLCTRQYRDGDLSAAHPHDVEAAIGWKGTPGVLFSALAEVGFIDVHNGTASVHDWYDHHGAAIRRQDESNRRVAEYRKRKRESGSIPIREFASSVTEELPIETQRGETCNALPSTGAVRGNAFHLGREKCNALPSTGCVDGGNITRENPWVTDFAQKLAIGTVLATRAPDDSEKIRPDQNGTDQTRGTEFRLTAAPHPLGGPIGPLALAEKKRGGNASAHPPLMAIPCSDGKVWNVTVEWLEKAKAAYPDIDIIAECKNARDMCAVAPRRASSIGIWLANRLGIAREKALRAKAFQSAPRPAPSQPPQVRYPKLVAPVQVGPAMTPEERAEIRAELARDLAAIKAPKTQ